MTTVNSFPLETTPLATALQAINFLLYRTTSTTSLTIEAGTKVFTVEEGKDFQPGNFVVAASDADPTNYMFGTIVSYAGTELTTSITAFGGSGTHADWGVQITGPAGAAGSLMYVQASAPPTDGPDGSLWIDSDSADLDLYQLVSGAWFDTTTNMKGLTGPAAWGAPAAWLTATAYTVGPPASLVTQGGETYVCLVSHTSGVFATDLAASKWIKVASKGADGAGTGDVTGQASSVDGEIALFSGIGGKTIKRASTTGLLKAASGVLAQAVAGTDYYNPGGTAVALVDGGTGSSTAAGARANLGAAGLTQTDWVGGIIRTGENKDYPIIEDIPHGATLTKFIAKTASGTITLTLKINTTAVTTGAINATSTQASATPSAANVMVATDKLVITGSSNASAVDVSFAVHFTKPLV